MNKIIVNCIAGAALTGKSGYLVSAVGTDTEKVNITSDETDTEVLGILQNEPADDGLAHVCVFGICEAVIGGSVEPFDFLMSDGSGKLIKHTGADAIAIARYIPRVKESGGTLSTPDGEDTRVCDVFLFGAQIRNPAA